VIAAAAITPREERITRPANKLTSNKIIRSDENAFPTSPRKNIE
jgi:hypothetical protein